MRVFIEIFLMCIMAQTLFCILPQPLEGAILAENAKVGNKSTILSLINEAGNCTAYAVFKSEQKYEQLKEYCERPFPYIPHENEFLSYEVVLCMVLYDTAQRVCEEERQGVTKVIQSSSNFSCDTMIKGVPKKSAESTKQWVTIFKAKFENVSNCKEKCIQDNLINPICEYILKANALMQQAQVSSNVSAGASHAKNVEHHGYSQGHGKVNKTITNSDKASENVAVFLSSAGGANLPVLKNGSQNTEHVDDKVAVSDNSTGHKDVDRAKANGNSTHSGSENNVGNNVKQHADAEDNSTRNVTNKQAHNTSSSMQNNGKHAINSNNQSGEVTPQNAAGSLPKYTERTPEGDKYDSTGKGVASDSKSTMAAQLENKNLAAVDAPDPEIQNQNVENEESVVSTDDNDNKVQDTGVAVNIPSDDEDQEDNINLDRQGEQSEQIPKETEAHQEEVETGSTAQFNQLGDADDSHFYAYFMTMVVICIIGYLVFHNKQKILALALEGRSRRGTRRRPNTSAYRKLDSNLEEAVTSTCSTSVTHVIY